MAFPLIAAIAAAAIGVGQTVAGHVANNKARGRAQDELNEKNKALDARITEAEKDLHTQYVDTPEAQAVLNQAKEDAQQESRRAENLAVMSGASNEAKIAARSAALKGYSNTLRSVAGYANQYRRNVQNRVDNLRDQKSGLHDQQIGIYDQEAQAGSNLVASGLNTMASAASIYAAGAGSAKAPAKGDFGAIPPNGTVSSTGTIPYTNTNPLFKPQITINP